MLTALSEMRARGILDPEYALKLLRRDFPPPPDKMEMRPDAAPLSEAIEITGEADEQNVGAVRRLMDELLRTPVIERGAIMPDACPAGVARATIPVGGAISVIVVTAFFAFPSPLQRLDFEQPNRAVMFFPFVRLPVLVVPIDAPEVRVVQADQVPLKLKRYSAVPIVVALAVI